jgi:hypothetical protein
MSRRLRLTLVILTCAGISTAAHAAQTAGAHPAVKPGTGRSQTRFVVSFRAPQSTIRTGPTQIRYAVVASLRSHPKGCLSSISVPVDHAGAGSMVHVKLNPKSAGRRWCTGRFHGKIEEIVTTVCGCPESPQMICFDVPCAGPAIFPIPETIGKFSFRVRK